MLNKKILFTTSDLVEMLSLCKNEILLAVKNGELKAIRRGNKFLFKKEFIDDFIQSMEVVNRGDNESEKND